MFSPWYAWARKRGPADPANHCALNVVLTGPGTKHWAMTERPARLIARSESDFRIAASAVAWDGHALTVDIDERTAPLPRPLRGRVTLRPAALASHIVNLDGAGHHFWSPIAPVARIDVALTDPHRTWSGPAYLDTNWGTRPLEQDFASWHWCRAPVADGTAILYYTTKTDTTRATTALHYAPDGTATPFPPPPEQALPSTFWRLPRSTATDPGRPATVQQTLEDAPFYARSVLNTHLLGQPVTAMHEMLSLRRFDTPWMRLMLPFKAPRYPFR